MKVRFRADGCTIRIEILDRPRPSGIVDLHYWGRDRLMHIPMHGLAYCGLIGRFQHLEGISHDALMVKYIPDTSILSTTRTCLHPQDFVYVMLMFETLSGEFAQTLIFLDYLWDVCVQDVNIGRDVGLYRPS